jgi:hypothetical protein
VQIIINQAEIERAITQYIQGTLSVNDDQQITMKIIASRGDEGFRAIINIAVKSDVSSEKDAAFFQKVTTLVEADGEVVLPSVELTTDHHTIETETKEPTSDVKLAAGKKRILFKPLARPNSAA